MSVFTPEREKTKQSHADFTQGAFQLGVPLVTPDQWNDSLLEADLPPKCMQNKIL